MKKRLAKKIEKMRRKKIHEALEMVLEINTTQVRSQELTDVDITVYQNGWRYGAGLSGRYSRHSHSDSAGGMDRLLKELANKKKELQDAGKM